MYWIVTDSGIDMPKSWIEAQEKMTVVPLAYLMDGEVHIPRGTDEETREIYDLMREGKTLTTSQITPIAWAEALRPLLSAGHDVLLIVFSSGLSGTCAAAMTAAEELREEFPDRRLEVIDSLCASAGQGLLVHYALKNRGAGMSLAENAAWVREHVQQVIHWFTVKDLMHLHRGGRLSAAGALLGTLARIKPVMHVDAAGRLAVKEKASGRKRSIVSLADRIRREIVHPEGQLILISHGDCEEEAQSLADMLRAEFPASEIQLTLIGPVIGAHSGPGTIAVFCLGESRVPMEK